MYVCMHICMYACMHACVHLCMYTHHTHDTYPSPLRATRVPCSSLSRVLLMARASFRLRKARSRLRGGFPRREAAGGPTTGPRVARAALRQGQTLSVEGFGRMVQRGSSASPRCRARKHLGTRSARTQFLRQSTPTPLRDSRRQSSHSPPKTRNCTPWRPQSLCCRRRLPGCARRLGHAWKRRAPPQRPQTASGQHQSVTAQPGAPAGAFLVSEWNESEWNEPDSLRQAEAAPQRHTRLMTTPARMASRV